MPRLGWTALAFAFLAGSAWAQESAAVPTEPLALRYEAPPACPGASTFFAQLRARTARVRAPAEGEARARARRPRRPRRARVHQAPPLRGGRHEQGPRVVEAVSCAEVVEALGLSAALAVDPLASTACRHLRALGLLPGRAFRRGPVGIPVSNERAGAVSRDRHDGPRSACAEPAARARAPRPASGAGLAVEAAALSGLVPSGHVFAEVMLRDRAAIFAPSLRGSFGRSLELDQELAFGSASLSWTVGALDACPLRVHLASNFALHPCAGFTAGVVSTRAGGGVVNARDPSRPWAALDLHGRLAWEPVGFLAIEMEAGAMAPLYREQFFFLPNFDVYQAPIIGLFGRAGASVRFP
ncbi:MAG: hypothetical protein U0270_35880 [Labilithrix sp.]